MKRMTICVLVLLLFTLPALGETLAYDGTVDAGSTVSITAAMGGTVESVSTKAGDKIAAGDTVATLSTTKVYAPQDGTVTAIFASEGENIDNTVTQYAGVVFIEPAVKYSISASTNNAYDKLENKIIHVGEQVYLSCYTDGGKHKGTGRVVAVSGTSYTVEVLTGEFESGESVNVFRDAAYLAASRLGRGSLSRQDPVGISGEGTLVKLHVAEGDTVQAGQLLFETLSGTADGAFSGSTLTSSLGGIVSEVTAAVGSEVAQGASILTLYPDGDVLLKAAIPESDLNFIQVGDSAAVEFNWSEDEADRYQGTLESISYLSETTDEGIVTYEASIRFTPDDRVRIGMSAVVYIESGATAQSTPAPSPSEEKPTE